MFQFVYTQFIFTSNGRPRLNHTVFDEYVKHIEDEQLQNLSYYDREIILKNYLVDFNGTRRYDRTVRPVREMETTINVTMIYELYGML